MSFEIYVNWFERGQPAPIPLDTVRRAFGAAVNAREAAGFSVRYGPADESFIYAKADATGAVASMSIDRPCAAPQLWDSIIGAMKLGYALCYWPGDVCAVAQSGALEHLPSGAVDEFGTPSLVADGASLAKLVAES